MIQGLRVPWEKVLQVWQVLQVLQVAWDLWEKGQTPRRASASPQQASTHSRLLVYEALSFKCTRP